MLEKINLPEDLISLSPEDLEKLAEDIRSYLIEKVTLCGGHLSPNLGIVELTIALHKVFNCPQDDFLWDVGHQCYVHKILTGRKDQFDRLRKKDGLSGFPSPLESLYDTFHAGHSSTSLSLAAGIAKAKMLNNRDSHTIAIIGDGSFTGGMIYEALNTIGHDNLPVIIILNDNGMSISRNVGGISQYLKKLQTSQSYLHIKRRLETLLQKKLPFGRRFVGLFYRLKELFKSTLIKRNFFEDMDICYYGPIDGHDIHKLIDTFHEIKGITKPIIIHVITTKGKGYAPSEDNPGKYHGIAGAKIPDESSPRVCKDEGEAYSEVFGKTLTEIADKDPKIFAITAAMKSGTGLNSFAEKHPSRFSDVGIAEEHAVDYAIGLSLQGYKPVVAIYSTFLQRSYDQLIHDAGIANAKILFCLDRAGLVPGDGETHQGIFDIAYGRTIPNFTLLMPSTKKEMQMMLEHSTQHLDSPIMLRYTKEEARDIPEYDPFKYPLVKGEGVSVLPGNDGLIISTGTLLRIAIEARSHLISDKYNIEVFNLRYAKPISNNNLNYFAGKKCPVLIVEEGIQTGGVAEYIAQEIRKLNSACRIDIIAIPDVFPSIGTRDELLTDFQFTSTDIVQKMKALLH